MSISSLKSGIGLKAENSSRSLLAGNSPSIPNTLIAIGSGSTGQTGGIISTDDGSTWTQFNLPVASGANIQASGEYLGYGNGMWVYAPYGQNNFYTSTNGTSWTSRNAPYAGFNSTFVFYTPSKGQWLIGTMYNLNRYAYSTDGITWSGSTVSNANVQLAGGFVNGNYMIMQHNDPNLNYGSTLGSAFTGNSSGSPSPYFGAGGVGAYNGTTLVFTGNYGSTNNLWYSTNGTSFSLGTMPTTGYWWGTQCYGFEAGVYVASGGGTVGASSTNGTSWTQRTHINIGNTEGLITYGKSVGFAKVQYNAGATSVFSTSPDGITWTAKTSPNIYAWTIQANQARNYARGA
jgi:hypothetical protein